MEALTRPLALLPMLVAMLGIPLYVPIWKGLDWLVARRARTACVSLWA